MNEQNKPLLTIHDLLAREEPSLRRANLPFTYRVIAYVATTHELMRRFYIDKPVGLLIKSSGICEGAVKPYFCFIHGIVNISIILMPTSFAQGHEEISYLCSWILTISLLPASFYTRWDEWRLLKEELEEEIEAHVN
ncbi:uncharacterized protein Bfra_008033 [Botrytis fragariae]|uniref:Uncharacterized protein n=1 Tax=Botrytis fragariae TaxID=1964551 RepID=A0A8H6EGH7_9HELO|nr:uncharacterized protein Bfra_008033 [Botrytis fragariae]KAF5871514.1 hypothetical protein Bfra_008033 [Botrytis fragariae]